MELPTDRRIAGYAEFWTHYLQEHAKPATRNLHFLGTFLALACVMAALATGRAWLYLAAAVAGYGPAWFSHFFLEKNRPATFTYPMWSLLSDFRRAWLWVTGHLEDELHRAAVPR